MNAFRISWFVALCSIAFFAIACGGPGNSGLDVAITGDAGPPVINGCSIYPANNPWNQRADTMPLHANAAGFRSGMNPTRTLHADWGNWSTDHYGIPWQVVPANQAPVAMNFVDYP